MNGEITRGNPVIVRTYGARAEVRVLVATREHGFIVALTADDTSSAVGVPRDDVFEFDQTAAERIATGQPLDWLRLLPLGNPTSSRGGGSRRD